MLNITNHYGNSSQNYNEILSHSHQDDYYPKIQNTGNLSTVDGNVKFSPSVENSKEVSQKIKNRISLLSNSSNSEYITRIERMILKRYLYTHFHAIIIHNGKIWKQTTCPLMGEWMDKIWYIHSMQYHSACKRK